MTFPVVWKRILDLNKDVDSLGEDVGFLDARAKKAVVEGKRSLFFETKEFQFDEDDLTFKRSTLVQSTDGIVILEAITYEVYGFNESVGRPNRAAMAPTPWGFSGILGAGGGALDARFDFDYNIELGASGVTYGQSLRDGVGFLNRRSLGLPLNQNRLDLGRPFYVKENEFLTFAIKPTRYAMPGPFKDPDTVYIVSVNAIGYKILGAHTT